jgi:NodT family efflux transporter outer membrane factor (OMF) lipoprotein
MALLTSACAVGPNYKRPSLAVPADYKERQAETASQWKPAQPSDVALRGKWWELFGDPELNALEEQVSVSNQNIAQAEAQFRGARAVARGARGDLFPTVTAGASVSRSRASRNRFSTNPTAPAGSTTNSYQVSGEVSYEVDAWGRIRRSVEASVENARASAADLETVRLSMHAELAVDYFLLHGIDAQRQLLASNVDAYEKALQLTINRHNQGIVSGVDVAQAETQLETTRAQLTDLAIVRAQLEHAIAILVGKPPADFTIAPAAIGVAPPEIPVTLPSELLERRPDVAAAERRVASANAQIGVAQAGFFPTLLLSASGGWGASTLTKFFSAPNLFWSLGAALAQTIFQGGKRIAAKEEALASYDASVAAYRLSVLTAFQDVEDSLAALRILAEESTQQERAVAAAERSLTLAKNRYDGGITTYLEVVTAQAVALADERAAVDLQTRRMTSSVDLVKALGGGWSTADLPSPGAVLSHPPTAADRPQ